MWVSVIAIGIIVGAAILKEKENRRAKAYVPVKVRDGRKARQHGK
jgi:hypothetical protein